MMWPLHVLEGPAWERLTWTLLHFLWQGLVIAAAAEVLLALLPLGRTQVRYALLVCGLALMALCPVVTFLVVQLPSVGPVQWPGSESSTWMASSRNHESTSLPAMESRAGAALPVPDALRPTIAAEETSRAAGEADPGTVLRRYVVMWSPYCLLTWLAGVLGISARLMMSLIGVRVLLRSRRPLSQDLLTCAGSLANRLGMASAPGVFLSQQLREAIAVGLWRPVVLLPLAWITEMPPNVLEAVIAHELAHIRRWDLWVSLVQRLMEALLFYQPAVWWLSRRISLEREMCTDELAVAATGQRVTYAEALELLGRRRLGDPAPQFGVAMGDRKMALLHRVRNVLGIASSHRRLCWWPAGLLALAVPLAIWLTSLSLSRPGVEEVQAAEEKGRSEATPVADNRIRPLDLLTIRAIGTLIDQPIDGTYLVEPSGKVALGPEYGRAEVKGLTVEEAEIAIKKQLEKTLAHPEVQVTAAGRVTQWRSGKPPEEPYRVSPNDLLQIQAYGTLMDAPINGDYVVEPSGKVPLGPAYGRVEVKGLTLEEAEKAITKHLQEILRNPGVSVTLGGWKSDALRRAELEKKLADLNSQIRKAKGQLEVLEDMRARLERQRNQLDEKLGKAVPAPSHGGPSRGDK